MSSWIGAPRLWLISWKNPWPFQGCWSEEPSPAVYSKASLNALLSSGDFVGGSHRLNSNLVITLCFWARASLSKALTKNLLFCATFRLPVRAFRDCQTEHLLRRVQAGLLWRASHWLVLNLVAETGLASRSHRSLTLQSVSSVSWAGTILGSLAIPRTRQSLFFFPNEITLYTKSLTGPYVLWSVMTL